MVYWGYAEVSLQKQQRLRSEEREVQKEEKDDQEEKEVAYGLNRLCEEGSSSLVLNVHGEVG